MIDIRTCIRRLFLALLGIATSAALLRPQLAQSLVIRGDDLAYRGNLSRSMAMYRRAIWFDAKNDTAVDRIAFGALMTHRRADIESGIDTTSEYLAQHPNDAVILMDRGLLLQVIRRYAGAERDFTAVGRRIHDARALTFAGFDAYHAGARKRARALWREAVAFDPNFLPAQRAMRRR
jgi:tetratricopeptide (TPR) repeat protein